jgi:hypothetical protein
LTEFPIFQSPPVGVATYEEGECVFSIRAIGFASKPPSLPNASPFIVVEQVVPILRGIGWLPLVELYGPTTLCTAVDLHPSRNAVIARQMARQLNDGVVRPWLG